MLPKAMLLYSEAIARRQHPFHFACLLQQQGSSCSIKIYETELPQAANLEQQQRSIASMDVFGTMISSYKVWTITRV
jgi:hypothetical protein